MNDDRVSRALKSLPREQAGLGFTAKVLRRTDETPSWSRFPFVPLRARFPFVPLRGNRARWIPMRWARVPWSAAVATAVLVLALGLGWREWRHRQAAQNFQVLLAEKQELEAELEALRKLTEEARPTVYLGGDDDVDLVLDLARFRRQGGFGSRPPASALPAENRPVVAARGEQTVRPLRVVF